ncbi:glycoside hydrolase family 130 protein [Acholeplasma hippikon]|uniref:Domain of uncharacterized function (DUF377) n=1 Tax=Acholeplasma hippikon TaxID=264636 RepID=A0A449BJ11_9MOLU|nr:glycoside hydrolase family 130 protein [Acholeplasma hippikon]VEU82420.1 Domain of uncharacterised function (DUF377) [Acholeplasma hippikon]
MRRAKQNPLITIKDIKPTHPSLKVDGVFNCGATKYNNQYILLLRIAESAISEDGYIKVPVLENKKLQIKLIDKNDKNLDFRDSRTIKNTESKVEYLTSLSHFRRAYSNDGIHFTVDKEPWIYPESEMESWGIEDPRVTHVLDKYLITYTAVSKHGVSVGLIETKDFISYERKGIILPVDNKDVSILPEKINGKYFMYHRPVPNDIGYPNMWSASSLDLTHWGEHKILLTVDENDWENGRIGGGAPSVKTNRGWLHIYHAANKDSVYKLGAFLTSLDDPTKILYKTSEPILSPFETYELHGFFGNVVFTCGIILESDEIKIYYGAADDKICLATISLDEIYQKLKPFRG